MTQISSNAKLVKWTDGTYGMYLGNEYYDIPGEMLNNQLVMTASVGRGDAERCDDPAEEGRLQWGDQEEGT